MVVAEDTQANLPVPAVLRGTPPPPVRGEHAGGEHLHVSSTPPTSILPVEAAPAPAIPAAPAPHPIWESSSAEGLSGAASADVALGLHQRRPRFSPPRSMLLYTAAGVAAALLVGVAGLAAVYYMGRAGGQPLGLGLAPGTDSQHGADTTGQKDRRVPGLAMPGKRGAASAGRRAPELPSEMQPTGDVARSAHSEKAGGTDVVAPAATDQPRADPTTAAQDGQAFGTDAQGQASTSKRFQKQPGRQPSRKRKSPEGLAGVSREYDDLQCQRIQAQHGVRVPPGAAIVEVDGTRLAVENVAALSESRAPFVFLPRGEHAVRFRANESLLQVHVEGHLGDEYRAMRIWFGFPSSPRLPDLLQRGAWAFDVHGAPFLLHLMGNVHVRQGDLAAAERKFRRALRINAAFAPAHLNLAHCLLQRAEQQQAAREALRQEAAREAMLAEAFNVGNVFGLSRQIAECKRACGLKADEPQAVRLEPQAYRGSERMDVIDERMVALVEGLAKYAVDDLERAKILNNLAVHFADSRKPELALDHFRNALAVLKFAGPERFEVARRVFANMSDACRTAGFAEAEEYDQMLELVLP